MHHKLNGVGNMKDLSTMYMDADLYTLMENPLTSIGEFFSGPVSKTHWSRDQEEVVMDMGCGPGNISTKLIVPLFPNLKRIYAVDLQQNMIDYAKQKHSHPKVEYSVGDISQWSSVGKWEGQISNFFSIHVFHWIKDQKQSFANVYQLLKPGGHAVFFFVLQSTFFSTCLDLKNDIRWSKYLKDVESFVPPSHIENYDPKYFTDMLTEMGFSIEYCNSEVKEDIYPSESVYRDFFSSICVVLPQIPIHLREEFKNDIFDFLMKRNSRINGLPVHRGRMLELIIKKL